MPGNFFFRSLLLTFFLFGSVLGYCQKKLARIETGNERLTFDTISFKSGFYFIGPTKYLYFREDTTIVITSFREKTPEEIDRFRTQTLYDSLYHKLGRRRLPKFLYTLAFVPPGGSILPDSVQTQKIEIPFLQYQGMYIREVQINILDPFGTSIFETARLPQSRAARFGNSVHMSTRKSVIKNQLLFKSGEHVNAEKIADNMRILNDLPYISGARIVVSETTPGSDTVDIIVITKDNWTIGASLIIIDLTRYRGSLYDANFLGSGDRLAIFWSINYNRAPFFRFDGITYTFTNISSSFIDATISLTQDDDGNATLLTQLSRPFFSYSTKLAGGISFTLAQTVSPLNNNPSQVATYHQEGGWLGLSSQLSSSDPSFRLVVAQSVGVRNYLSRPEITPDSNVVFSNSTTFLTNLQISRNKYYNADYILQFGKPETFPYGFLGQVTVGPAINDYYTRFYMSFMASGGNFINKFGYLSGRLSLGSYLRRDNFEDGILKIEALYMSFLYFSKSKRFKFRSYITYRYSYLFNATKNNTDYYNLAEEAKIPTVINDSLFYGSQVNFLSFSTVAYTPWYFYGFRFALQGTVWAGMASSSGKSLWKSRFMTGIGIGLMFRNDNLIFPTVMISCFIYPTTPGIPLVQFDLFETSSIKKRDYGPTAPYVQTMSN